MDGLTAILNMLLSYLLQFATLFVDFIISALNLFLSFLTHLIGLAS